MKEINLDVVKDAAHRLLFDMPEEEYGLLLAELEFLRKQMDAIGDAEGYEPMTFPFECTTTEMREDEPSQPLDREDVLSNAGSKQDGQIKLPKVVG